jgi:SAM-dependent methyltransferase
MDVRDKPSPVSHIREHPELIDEDLRALRRLAEAGGRILDVGAGPGGFVLSANAAGFITIGVDVEESAREPWIESGSPCVLGDGYHLPFRSRVFDVVRVKEVIEHVQEPLALAREVVRVARDGGIVMAHVPSPFSQFFPIANFWDDYTHVRPLTKQGLRRLFEDAGLDVVEIKGYVAGRNRIERAAGKVMGLVVPHTYRIIGRNASS